LREKVISNSIGLTANTLVNPRGLAPLEACKVASFGYHQGIMKRFLLLLGISAFSVCLNAADSGSFKGPLGLQLYSLRADFAKDVPSTLDKVASFGIKEVELAGTYDKTPEEFLKLLQARGLHAVSGHFSFDRYRTEPEKVAAEAKALGLKYAGCAWIPHKDDFDEAEARDAVAVFNHAGEILAKEGIQFFYHTHGYEFQPFEKGTLFDLLMKETNPKYVTFQMDVFWIVHPGQDPAKLLMAYPNRWALMHVKDMKPGTKGDLTGHTDVSNDVQIGTGKLNWPSILSAAKKVGIKYYFIEDESPDAAKQIPGSIKYLNEVKF
jgi:sugar phosphate isomerase/epimerase